MSLFSAQQVHIGPVTLQTHVFLLLVAALAAAVLVLFRLRGDREGRRLFFDSLSTAALLVLLGWKLFPLFYAFSEMVTRPMTLLYTPGGTPGLIFGLVLGSLYFAYKIIRGRRHKSPEGMLLSPFMVFAASFIMGSAVLLAGSSALRAEQGEQPAIPFSATTIQGEKLSLDDLKGKTVILNFWATWCPPCRAELPTLVAFNEELKGTETVLISVASGPTQTQSRVTPFLVKEGIHYPIILDTSREITSRYGVRSLPTSVVISPEGTITDRLTGAVDRYWLRSHLFTRPEP